MPRSRPLERAAQAQAVRDAGLRRLSRLTRRTIAAAAALTGVFAAVAANAFPGRSSTSPARSTSARQVPAQATTSGHGRARGSSRSRPTIAPPPPLQPPLQAPAPTQAPPVVVSGGS